MYFFLLVLGDALEHDLMANENITNVSFTGLFECICLGIRSVKIFQNSLTTFLFKNYYFCSFFLPVCLLSGDNIFGNSTVSF